MTGSTQFTAIGVFADRSHAEKAIEELRRAGFVDSRIGVACREKPVLAGAKALEEDKASSLLAESAGIGVLVGASLGGLAVGVGALPFIGPIIAGGIFSGLIGGALAGGLIGVLVGMGVPEEEAHYYQSELEAGNTLVTVNAGERYDQAMAILHRHGGHNDSPRLSKAGIGPLP